MTTNAAGSHSHATPEIDAAIAALEARVAALEAQPEPEPDPEPPPPPTGKVAKVASVVNLLDALADNTVDEIVMANGRYAHDIASHKSATSLWIGADFAARTRPVLVRAETLGGVTFDGNQQRWWGGIIVADGAHDQTWRGFRWVNGEPTGTGAIVIGGYTNLKPTRNIVFEDCEIAEPWGSDTEQHGHAVYISQAYGGPHTGLVFDRFKATDTGTHIGGGIHIYHDSYDGAGLKNYHNVQGLIVRKSVFTGLRVGFYIWAHTAKDILIEDCRVIGSREYGVRYERGENVTLRRVVTSGSKYAGIAPTSYVPGGPYRYPSIPELGPDMEPGPKLVTFEACDFR